MNNKRMTTLKNSEMSFSNHRTYMYTKGKNTDENKKFDQLLNEKCSWSYRSQKVVSRNIVNENFGKSSLKLENTVMTVEVSGNNCNEVPSPVNTHFKDWSRNKPRRMITQKKNSRSKRTTKNSSAQKKVKNVKRRVYGKKPKHSEKTSKIVNANKVEEKRNLKDRVDIKSSSSDEDVLQTRYSIRTTYPLAVNENNGFDYGSENEEPFRDENDIENSTPERTSPIIIQATAFHGNEETHLIQEKNKKSLEYRASKNYDDQIYNHSEGTKFQLCGMDTSSLEENKQMSAKENGLNLLTSAKDQNTLETISDIPNNSEQFPDNKSNYSACMNYYEDEFKTSSDDQIISEFLNGSLDLNIHRDNTVCHNNSLAVEHETNASPELFTDDDFDVNIIKKRKTKTLKKSQQSKSVAKGIGSKTLERPTIQYLTQSSTKIKGRNYTSSKKVNEKLKISEEEIMNDEKKRKSKKCSDSDKSIECISIDSTEDQLTTLSGNCVMLNSSPENTGAHRKKKKARSSSLAATKRIKAIRKFENSGLSSDSDICLIHEKRNSAPMLDHIKGRLNKIGKNTRNKTSKSQKENINDFRVGNNKKNEKTRKYTKRKADKISKSNNVKSNKSLQNVHKCKLDLEGKKISQTSELTAKNCYSFDEDSIKEENVHSERKKTKKNNMNTKKPLSKISRKKCSNTLLLPNHKDTQCKTWKDLEQELLNEADYEIPPADTTNISETVILKQERLVHKNRNASNNVWEVSNTSMTQTISKYGKSNRYNVQYAESKYFESSLNDWNCQKGRNFESSLLNEIVPIQPMTPVEKAIAAMNQCTAEFSKPPEIGKKLIETNLQLQENDVDSKEESQLNIQTIFTDSNSLIEENEFQSNSDQIAFESQNSNFNEITNVNSWTKCHKGSENSNSAALQNFFQKIQFFSNNLEKSNEDQALTTSYLKINNPWDKLTNKLKLDEENEQKVTHCEHLFKAVKQSCNMDEGGRDFVEETLHDKNLLHGKEKIQHSDDEHKVSDHQTGKLLKKKHVIKSGTSSNFANLHNEFPETMLNERVNSKSNTCTPAKKMKTQLIHKSPTYRFEANRDGFLKLKLQSKRSSTSNTSGDSPENVREILANTPKTDDANKHTNETRKKYSNYIKHLSTSCTLRAEADSKEDLNVCENKANGEGNKKLIAENDSDIFSLSSSDAENDGNQGTGYLCELFNG